MATRSLVFAMIVGLAAVSAAPAAQAHEPCGGPVHGVRRTQLRLRPDDRLRPFAVPHHPPADDHHFLPADPPVHPPRGSMRGPGLKQDAAEQVLRRSLQGGAAYFICVTIAHWAGIKVPGLFVYYNISSYAYQDRGIGILAFGWAMFLLAASRHLVIVPYVVAAGIAGILGFSAINLSAELAALAWLQEVKMAGFWSVVVGLAAYLSWIILWWRRTE